jgi:glycosyltransferase involved in cell wall biosynthesis
MRLFRQPHAGVSVARNAGVKLSRGSVLVFLDADSRLRPNCLSVLCSTIAALPQYSCFQLHLVGDRAGLVGRAEELRLAALQHSLIRPDGCIRYLNTAGFAIRRSRVELERGVFDPVAIRAQDTLLLAELMQAGELPYFVAGAVVQHAVALSLKRYLLKSIRTGRLETRTFELIAARGVRIRISHRERLGMLLSMWKTSRQQSIGRAAWLVTVANQTLRLVSSLAQRWLQPNRPRVNCGSPDPPDHFPGPR